MSDVLDYIKNNPQETQRLIGLKYEQLEQLINSSDRVTYPKATGNRSKES